MARLEWRLQRKAKWDIDKEDKGRETDKEDKETKKTRSAMLHEEALVTRWEREERVGKRQREKHSKGRSGD